MPKKKIISRKRSDAFRTYRGELMTRQQLSTKISMLNKKARNPKYLMSYMTMGEYEQSKKFYNQLSKAVYGEEKSFSIRGVHDVRELKQIEQAVTRLLDSYYYNKPRYEEAKEKQLKSLSRTFSGIEENRLKNLYEIFKTDIWHHLIDNQLLDSEQIIDLINQYGGLDEDKISQVVLILECVERESSRKGTALDDELETMLNDYKETIWT